jgi:tetratricopeptide (TPR) repeat protein
MSGIEKLLEQKRWGKARALIQEELVSAPTDHWLWTTLGLTYYEEKQYEKALECSKRAVELQPDCPLVLWDYAGTLEMCAREEAALAIWTVLLDMDLEEVAYGECGEGMDWALQLINDVHYRMGRYFSRKGKDEQARTAFRKYLHNRKHGVGSIYSTKDVEKYIFALAPAGGSADSAATAKRTKKS